MRDLALKIGLLLVLLAVAGVAWLTRYPESPWLERATGWPGIGPWAERFREVYLPPPSRPADPDEEDEIIVYVDRFGREVDDPGSAFSSPDEVVGARPFVWVQADLPIVEEPRPGAAEIARTTAITNLGYSARRGDWFQVRYRGRQGWVLVEDYEESTEPPLGSDPVPPGPLEASPPDPSRLEFARARLEDGGRPVRLGPYQGYVGREQVELVPFLDRVVRSVEELYARRYGVEPIGTADGAVVLFDRRASFLEYQGQETSIPTARLSGVTGGGVVAIDTEGRGRDEIASTLVHEVVHLLNKRALGPALPVWLEEGLADGIAQSRIEADGTIDVTRLGGTAVESPVRWEWHGALASALLLRRAADEHRLVSLDRLLTLDASDFVAEPSSELHYAQAAYFVRYLLEDAELAAGFRAYLRGVAAGGAVEPAELHRHLGRPFDRLDSDFAAWLKLTFLEPV